MPEDRDSDDASAEQELAAYWRHRRRTSRALVCIAAAIVVLLVFHNPRAWGDGEAATLLTDVARVGLWIAGLVAYVSNARMAERRGFLLGRFRRSPTEPSQIT